MANATRHNLPETVGDNAMYLAVNYEKTIKIINQLKEIIIRDEYNLEPPCFDLDNHIKNISLLTEPNRKITHFLKQSDEYQYFLKSMNGAEYNGLILYGLSESEYKNASSHNIFSINAELWDDGSLSEEALKNHVVFGENSTSIFSYNSKSSKYEIRDRIGIDRLDNSYDFFYQLLEEELRKHNILRRTDDKTIL